MHFPALSPRPTATGPLHRTVVSVGAATGAALIVLASSAPASAATVPAGTLAGYTATSPPAHGRARATFTVPKITPRGTYLTSSSLVGVSVWDVGGNDVGAVVKLAFSPTGRPAYTAEGFYFNSVTGTTTVTKLKMSVAAGQTVVITAVAGSPSSTATVDDKTTGVSKTATFGASGFGPAITGDFCAMDWNAATACFAPPNFTKIKFSDVKDDGVALGSLPNSASSMSGISPSALTPSGLGFTDT